MRKAVFVFMIILVAVLGWWMFAGSSGAPKAGDKLRILFTGESLGRFDPCMCEGHLAGGIAFRQGFIKQQRGDYLLLDTGCVASGLGELELLRAEEVFRAMKGMGYHATNAGETEIALGFDNLNRMCAQGVKIVSLNVRAASGNPLWHKEVTLNIGGIDILITGIADETHAPGPGLIVEPHAEALARWVDASRLRKAALIVLSDLGLEQAKALAEDFPEISVILFRGRGDTHGPELVNRTILASVYGSRYIAGVNLEWKTSRQVAATGEVAELDEKFSGTKHKLQAPIGIESDPPTLEFGQFRKGITQTRKLTIHNRNSEPVTLGRVYSPCTCFALSVRETTVPANGQAVIDVTLHSLELSGSVSFPLYVEVKGATSGILTVPANATVAEQETTHAP